MERRPSATGRAAGIAVAAAGLVVALAIALLGRRTSPDDLRAAAADLQALIRENAAAVNERAETLAQMPRIGYAVATDETTVRDLTSDELAFRTHEGEHIEITQMRRDGGEPRRLLRRPADSNVDLPLTVGTHVVVREGNLQLVTVVSIEPREHADLMFGLLAVAKQMDASAITQRLAARGINAEVRTMQGSFVLAGKAPSAVDVTIPLTGPGTEGLALVGSNARRARWPFVVVPLILVLSLAGGVLLWRRESSPRERALPAPALPDTPAEPPPPIVAAPPPPPAPAPRPTAPAATTPHLPPSPPPAPAPRLSRATPTASPGARPSRPTPVEAYPTRLPTPSLGARAAPPDAPPRRPTPPPGPKVTPITGLPSIPAEAIPSPIDTRSDLAQSGHVDVSLVRTGSVALPPGGLGRTAPLPPSNSAADPKTEEYRSLFSEFVKMRKTTGEPVADLDADRFIATLREKRAQIMKQIPVKDVKFKLAFQNGKAAIRYLTVS